MINSKKLISLVFVGIALMWVVVAVGVIVLLPAFQNSDYDTPNAVLNSYLKAISIKDRTKISNLLAPKHETENVINEKLMLYGGINTENVIIDYMPTESANAMWVNLEINTLQKDGSRKTTKDTLFLQKQQKRWFIVFGKSTEYPISEAPSSITK